MNLHWFHYDNNNDSNKNNNSNDRNTTAAKEMLWPIPAQLLLTQSSLEQILMKLCTGLNTRQRNVSMDKINKADTIIDLTHMQTHCAPQRGGFLVGIGGMGKPSASTSERASDQPCRGK